MLRRRTLGFARYAYRETGDPNWRLALERDHPILHAPTFQGALDLLRQTRDTPPWLTLALASHKIKSPVDAHSALYDLALALSPNASHALPLSILTLHSLAYFSLVSLLRPLITHVISLHTYDSFYFNMLLQAISLFHRSPTATRSAIQILRVMQNRGLSLWPDTERVLISDSFRSPQLLDHLSPPSSERSEAWLRAYASFGRVRSSAHHLHSIRKHCLENGLAPPYTTEQHDLQGIAHNANTYYLRAMRDDRPSAFRYFHHLLKLDISKSPPLPRPLKKSNIDIYDWTTALYAGAHDRSLSARSLLDLFSATKEGTDAYKPTRATYTVVIQGLLWRNSLQDAQKLWDEFVGEVVAARGNDGNQMNIDRKALCVGIDLLIRSRRTDEALYLLDQAVMQEASRAPPNPAEPVPYLSVHPIHALLTALLHIRRPDAVFYIWSHLTSLYLVPPTNLMLRILLKAAIQASQMDGESLRGAMSWYIAHNNLFKKAAMTPCQTIDPDDKQSRPSPSRKILAANLCALLQTPSPPPVVGIWGNRRSTDVARSIFRGMIFGNWPALRGAAGHFGGGVTSSRIKGGESVLQELARVFASQPDRFLPPHPTPLGTQRPTMARPDNESERMGPPLPTVIPSESTFAAYISLLGLSSRAGEIPEVLVWMRALEVVPKTETLAVALVFWTEVGLRGPVFEDGWTGSERSTKAPDDPPRTEYGALRAWIRDWVGEERAPTEQDICAGIQRVRVMRDSRFGKRGGHVAARDARSSEEN